MTYKVMPFDGPDRAMFAPEDTGAKRTTRIVPVVVLGEAKS